jgi:hypothetical protein
MVAEEGEVTIEHVAVVLNGRRLGSTLAHAALVADAALAAERRLQLAYGRLES